MKLWPFKKKPIIVPEETFINTSSRRTSSFIYRVASSDPVSEYPRLGENITMTKWDFEEQIRLLEQVFAWCLKYQYLTTVSPNSFEFRPTKNTTREITFLFLYDYIGFPTEIERFRLSVDNIEGTSAFKTRVDVLHQQILTFRCHAFLDKFVTKFYRGLEIRSPGEYIDQDIWPSVHIVNPDLWIYYLISNCLNDYADFSGINNR